MLMKRRRHGRIANQTSHLPLEARLKLRALREEIVTTFMLGDHDAHARLCREAELILRLADRTPGRQAHGNHDGD